MKQYIIKKRVEANSIEEALKLERKAQPEEIWVDNQQPEAKGSSSAIGFQIW